MADNELRIERIARLDTIPAADWDALDRNGNPFLSHDFLAGLERYNCLEPQGWYPQHLIAMQGDRLVAALPLYLRDNSFGEFVFDWNWADAHERSIGPYYPKLVSAIPFTPVTGQRILVHPQSNEPQQLAGLLIDRAIRLTDDESLSSLHILFPELPVQSHTDPFSQAGMLLRSGCQYHWYNDNYRDFDHFLAALTSKRRKEIRRERRSLDDSGLTIELCRGHEITVTQWAVFYDFYCSTFERKWGVPRLSHDFFQHLGASHTSEPLLLLAHDGSRYVAGAFAVIGRDTLYGRHWGCSAGYRNLHFELCYYQTIEFCIRQGLTHLDAGAQGEHKISRGFVPVATRSYHWLRDPRFRQAVANFLDQEQPLVADYITDLTRHIAYKHGTEAG